MRLLLDTHALLWWLADDPRLSPRARRAIASTGNEIIVSAVTAWEMAIKHKAGKLEIEELLNGLEDKLAEEGFSVLPISLEHAVRAGGLVEHHKDPFDRMLAAQCQAEGLAIISSDTLFAHYGVRRIWQ